MNNYQKAIIEFIKLTGFTQRQIAINSGFTAEQVSDWKNGRRSISLDNYVHLCNSNGINPDVPLSKMATNEAFENIENESLKNK